MRLPWYFKILAKLILARLPISYAIWQRLGLFRHGKMDQVNYARKIFVNHTALACSESSGLRGKTLLELGPGDSLASGLLAHLQGAAHTYLIDVGDFAANRPDVYARLLDQPHLPNDLSLDHLQTRAGFLRATHSTYLTAGLASLRHVPDHSVDFAWSHSVLEHIRLHDFLPVLCELKRILKPGGLTSHNIDFQDHLDHALNNLRFSQGLWESDFFAASGFYTNRIPYPHMIDLFRQAGFEILRTEGGTWPHLPTPQSKMAPPFRDMPPDDLITRTGYILARA